MNIKETLIDLGYSLTELPHEFRCRPIYRESGNNTSLRILKSSGRWIDFSANKRGNFLDLVALTLGLKNIDEAREHLSNYNFRFDLISNAEEEKILLPSFFDIKEIDKIKKTHQYWIDRGISKQVISLFKGGICENGKMNNRYTFPIFENEKIIGFSGRDISAKKSEYRPKWKHLGNKSFWLYPLFVNEAEIRKQNEIILVESIGDCLSLFEAGIKNSMVIFGTFLSKSVIKKLIEFDLNKIYISLNNDFDNGGVGNRASEEIKSRLLGFFDESQIEIKLPKLKDFNEMLIQSKEELSQFYANK